jgi:hypothetical protein
MIVISVRANSQILVCSPIVLGCGLKKSLSKRFVATRLEDGRGTVLYV